ncbi:MAG TPA: DegV family protein [Clostridiaceae bacterium]
MNKIAIVTDSSCDLNKEQVEENNIRVLPLRVIYKDNEYKDRVDITPQQVYDRLSSEIPTTSLPSLEDIEKLYKDIIAEGYTHIIAITISSGLSGTFNAIKVISENHPEITSYIYDSKVLSLGLGIIVLECAKLIQSGSSYEQIIDALPKLKESVSVNFVLETLEYLKKGGRIGLVSATIGELLKMKPIISVNAEGKYFTIAKVRGRKQSISKLIDIAMETLRKTRASIYILQGDAMEEAKPILDIFRKMPNLVSLSLSDISPSLVVHTGPGLIGIIVQKEI